MVSWNGSEREIWTERFYGLDWSDTGECHDHTGVHRTSGRIYKFFHQKNPVADMSVLENGFDHPGDPSASKYLVLSSIFTIPC